MTLKDLVVWLGAEIGMAARPEKAWRWENRGVVPESEVQHVLARRLGVPAGRLLTHPWPDWLPCGDRAPVETEWTLAGCFRVLEQAVEINALDRRGFLTLSAGSAARLAGSWASTQLPVQLPLLEAGDHAASFEARLPFLRTLEDRKGGAAVALLDSEMRTAVNALKLVDASSMRRVLAVIAELGRIAGWACVDLGAHAAAETRFIAGLRAAHAIGDDSSGANLLKCLSLLLVEHGRGREAAEIAHIASVRSAASPPRVQAMLAVREARVMASLGESRVCEQLLYKAEGMMAHADDGEVPGWAEYFDAAEFQAQVGACYLALRDYQACDVYLERALDAQPADRARDAVTYTMWRAEAAVRLGHVDRACSLVKRVLPGLSPSRSSRNGAHLAEVCRLLRPHRLTSCVRELDDQVRALVA